MGLTDVQKHLLSYFNLIKIAPLNITLNVYKEALQAVSDDKTPNVTNLLDEVSEINNEIRHYDLEVVQTVDENTPQELFIIVNIADNLMTHVFIDNKIQQSIEKEVKVLISGITPLFQKLINEKQAQGSH